MADPEQKKPLKPPSPRPLISFALGGPERPLVQLPAPPILTPAGGLGFLGDFVAATAGLKGDLTAPIGSAPPSLGTLAGMAAGMIPLGALRGATALGRGLYSRVDDALRLLPVKGAHANKVLSILKSNASAEELAFRKVPEWLAAQGNTPVTPEALAAHLQAHPAPMPNVVTRGARPADLLQKQQAAGDRVATMRAAAFDDPTDWVGVSDLDRTNAHWWALEAAGGDARALRKLKEIAVDPDHLETLLAFGRARNESTAVARQIEAVPTTKYGNYTVPGGENYQETLLTLPKPQKESYSSFIDKMEKKYGAGYETATLTPDEQAMQTSLWNDAQEYGHTGGRPDDTQFRSGHWEEPNVVVHTRSNERTLPTGERGRFVEEVQSDWHQQGKKQGYAPADAAAIEADLRARDLALTDELRALGEGDTAQHRVLRAQQGALVDEWNAFHDVQRAGIPDVPFKETWPDLGLKQQLLETVNDPEAQWLGFTSGQTQAARYDLSKQISEVHYSGTNLKAYDHAGNQVISQTGITPEQLPDYIGKEAADKLLAQEPQGTLRSLTGVDLQTGGEGMQYFYDQLLRKRLEKIVKPFGGTVERGRISGDPTAPPEVVAQYANQPEHPFTKNQNIPMWFARLSPEMKARIQREGLPLLTFLGGASLASLGQPRPREERR